MSPEWNKIVREAMALDLRDQQGRTPGEVLWDASGGGTDLAWSEAHGVHEICERLAHAVLAAFADHYRREGAVAALRWLAGQFEDDAATPEEMTGFANAVESGEVTPWNQEGDGR